jgi:glucose-6-phosphate isomerase
VSAYTLAAGPLAIPFAQACVRLDEVGFADALWNRRLDVWPGDTATRDKIANRLGWLSALDFVTPHLPRLSELGERVRRDGLTDVILLGMGGSSLAPEVLRQVLGVAPGFPRFRMLDSVDPDAVRHALDPAATALFVLASKSGGTIEPNVMAAEAQRRLRAAGHAEPGQRFVAVTDENTVLHRRAAEERFRDVFVNPADIGGRYSALSFFGLVPAALMGADLNRFTAAARYMEAACKVPTAEQNAGLALGAYMAAGALSKRDKLTLLLPERLQSFGLWVEQLVAESTGKQGKGVVPIAGETDEALFGDDRIAVIVTVGGEGPDVALTDRARAAGLPIMTIAMTDEYALGAEFFRWEFATAAAGYLLGINPFDEPNVQQAKDATRVLLDAYQQHGHLPLPEAHASAEGARFTLSSAAESELAGDPALAFLRLVRPHDYCGLLAYLPPDLSTFDNLLREFRMAISARTGAATMFGYGPRYLHSTGQLHKGGANNGVFIVLTADAGEDLPVPGERFSFGVLEMAQAIGDFQSLDRTSRRALHLHLPQRDPFLLRRVMGALVNGR